MQREEVFARVRAAMVRVFQLSNAQNISRDTSTADIDGWDSLSHAMLIMAIENDFGIDMPLDRASLAHTAGDLTDIACDLLGVKD